MVARKRTPAKPVAPKEVAPAPVPVVVEKSSAPMWAIVGIFAVAVGYYVIRSERGISPSPEPQPQPKPASVQSLVSEARKSLLAGYGNAFEQAAKGVESGEIKLARQVFELTNPATKKAREAALAPIDHYANTSLPRDVDTLKPEAAKFLREIADAFKREAK